MKRCLGVGCRLGWEAGRKEGKRLKEGVYDLAFPTLADAGGWMPRFPWWHQERPVAVLLSSSFTVLQPDTVGKATGRLILSAGTDESLYSIPGNLHAISIRVKNGQFLYPV